MKNENGHPDMGNGQRKIKMAIPTRESADEK